MTQVIFDPHDPTQVVIENATKGVFGIHGGSVTIHKIHLSSECAGNYCVIHNPSNHHMRSWPLVWRGDKGVFERTCRHGVGHPDIDDAAYLKRAGKDYMTTHGCCADCCCAND
jgi:hypothetical protein